MRKLNGRKTALILIILASLAVAVTYAAIMQNLTIPSKGQVKTVGIGAYKDSGCTQILTEIDWGFLSPGETKTATFYLKNNGNVNVTLTMTVANWDPAAAGGFITVSWNRENMFLGVGQSVDATVTLRVDSGIVGVSGFTFDLVVMATEA